MRSAGLLPYRLEHGLEVLIAHPGGPYFARKDLGWWSVVKGEVKQGESEEDAAVREFEEETGWPVPETLWVPLGRTTLRSGKIVVVWAIEYRFNIEQFNPGMFTLHGRKYPEIDRVEWMAAEPARAKLNSSQAVFVDRLEIHLGLNG